MQESRMELHAIITELLAIARKYNPLVLETLSSMQRGQCLIYNSTDQV